jgi:Tfp pilus assembly protein PilF
MLRKVLFPALIVALFLSACSNSSEPAQTNKDARKCGAIVKLFTEKIRTEDKAEKIKTWQMVLDNPNCFTSEAPEIAKTEISALQSQG